MPENLFGFNVDLPVGMEGLFDGIRWWNHGFGEREGRVCKWLMLFWLWKLIVDRKPILDFFDLCR